MKTAYILILLIALPIMLLSIKTTYDRNWRPISILTQEDYSGTRTLVDTKVDSIFYYNDFSNRIDNIKEYVYSIALSEWQLYQTYIYTYDTSGNHLMQIDYLNSNYAFPILKKFFTYDTQNRLLSIEIHNYTSAADFYIFSREDYIYNPYFIEQTILHKVYETGYERKVFAHDLAGRVSSITRNFSADSLNWEPMDYTEYTYNDNDTSQAEEYTQYLIDMAVSNSIWEVRPDIMYDSYITYATWTGTCWNIANQYIYNYNTMNNLGNVLHRYLGIDWMDTDRYVYSYDTNNNISQVDYQLWDSLMVAWSAPLNRVIYNWNQTTANEDETIPAASESLAVYPNPFRGSVNIRFDSKSASPVETTVFNIKGQIIKTFSNSKSVNWDGRDDSNKLVSSGVYFIKVNQDGKSVSRKVIKIN